MVFPPDALDQILDGQSAPIEILHEKLDPFEQAAIEIAARLAVQEVNASVLGAIAAEAQEALAPVDEAASELTEQAASLSAAVAAGDTAAMADTAGTAGETLRNVGVVVATSQGVVAAPRRRSRRRRRATCSRASTRRPRRPTRSAPVAAPTSPHRLRPWRRRWRTSPRRSPTWRPLDPAVLVRPFEADTSSIAPVAIEPVDYFAPSAVALLLQHLALTFAALSLVRDRELGLLELLRVGPLSSVEILVGKTVAYLTVGLAVGASLLAAAVLVLDVPLQGEVLWVAAVVVLVLLASLSLGMILSMISGSETQAVQYAMLSLLAGMFFSGFFLDVSQLATPYRYVSYVLPVTYGINALHDVMLRGAEPATADLVGLGVLVVVYGSLAVLLLRRRLRVE